MDLVKKLPLTGADVIVRKARQFIARPSLPDDERTWEQGCAINGSALRTMASAPVVLFREAAHDEIRSLRFSRGEKRMQDITQRIEAVRNDREHGSRWLVRETLLILRDLARQPIASEDEHLRQLYQSGRALASARPSMAALASAVGRVLNAAGGVPAIERAAETLLEEYDTATERITEYARPYLHGHILTCSLSGTVLDVLVACRQAIERIVVMEGRPRYEGRDLAQALGQQGIAVTLITDAQADIFLPHCQCIVVGADSVLANGDIINKSGTALLAWAGRGHHCPFYVLCESLKIAPYEWKGETLLEEKEPEEVLAQPIPGVEARNFYFDRTLARLVSGVITEHGLLNRAQIRRIATETRRNAELLARS